METRANDGANGYFLAACVAEKGYFCQKTSGRPRGVCIALPLHWRGLPHRFSSIAVN